MQKKTLSRSLLLMLWLALVLAVASESVRPVSAATITVFPGEVAIANNGRCSLREAIINANNDAATHADCPAGAGDDIITLPAATYTLSDATAANEEFSVTGDLDIRSNITLNGADAGLTILAGNNTDRVLHVVSGIAVVNDLTIQNGRTPNGANASMNCTSEPCFPTSSGSAGSPGGGILNAGTLTLNHVTLTNNRTGNGGNAGNVSCSSGFCSTNGGNGGAGGGVHSTGASLTINHSTLSNNQTGTGGAAGTTTGCSGGAFCSSTAGGQGDGGGANTANANPLTISNSLVTNNSGRFGGGISCFGACTIVNSTISNNQATSIGGGIYFVNNGNKVVTNVTITGNTSVNNGGGIFANLGTIAITNVTISGNSANTNGGGAFVNGATTTFNHVTIVGNTADSDNNGSGNGGGLFANGTNLYLRNSIVADNFDLGGQAPDCANTINSQFYNHIESVAGCTFTPGTGDVTGSDPNLGALANNGGPTFTHLPNVGSVVLDTIPNGTNDCGTLITNDQRGAGRSFPSGGSCDKGAVELHEIISVGNCAGADLAGVQNFPFSSGNTLSLDVVTAAGLKCVSIEEMGPGVNHAQATAPIQTNNWWHIRGNISSGFDVNLTLPYASADAATRACKWPGGLGGDGWDCGPLDGTGTTHVANTSVTRSGLGSFSDWAVGDEAGPTAVTLSNLSTSPASLWLWLVSGLTGLLGGTVAALLRRRTA